MCKNIPESWSDVYKYNGVNLNENLPKGSRITIINTVNPNEEQRNPKNKQPIKNYTLDDYI